MSYELVLLLASVAIATVAARRAPASPLAVSLWLWVGIAGFLFVDPLRLTPMTGETCAAIVTGLAFLATPLWFRSAPASEVAQGDRSVALARTVMAVVVLAGLVALGAYTFRAGIADATGQGYASLSLTQVRAAQTSSARGGGLLALASAAFPVAACLGVYGWLRYSRWYLALTALAIAASVQSPARLATLSLLVATLVFWLYARRVLPRRPSRTLSPKGRRRATVAVVVGGVVALLFFNAVGERLGKNTIALTYFGQSSIPDALITPVLYFVGGIPALSTAMQMGQSPLDHGTSIYSLLRVASFADPSVVTPSSAGEFVRIPIPFNVFTGFGQSYLDFGYLGVAVLAFLLGALAAAAHKRAMSGRLEWAWVSAVVAALLLSMPQAYRLFFIDVDVQLVVGFLLFLWLRKSARRGRPPLGGGRVDQEPAVGESREQPRQRGVAAP